MILAFLAFFASPAQAKVCRGTVTFTWLQPIAGAEMWVGVHHEHTNKQAHMFTRHLEVPLTAEQPTGTLCLEQSVSPEAINRVAVNVNMAGDVQSLYRPAFIELGFKPGMVATYLIDGHTYWDIMQEPAVQVTEPVNLLVEIFGDCSHQPD